MSDVKPRVWYIETHEIMKGKINQHGQQLWPQVYEHDMGHTIQVIEFSAYEALRAQNEELVRVLESTKCVCGYELLNSEGVYHLGCWVPSSSKKLIQKCSRCEALAKYRGKNG